MFCQSVVASVLFYAVVCWEGSVKKKDALRLDELVRWAGSVVGLKQDNLESVVVRRKLLTVRDNERHPLHDTIAKYGQWQAAFPELLNGQTQKSSIPRAIRLYNSSCQSSS